MRRIATLLGLLLGLAASGWALSSVAAPRLATFDFALGETLNALGHPPVAQAGLDGYQHYARQTGIFPPETANLGGRFQPNFEYLASQKPDAILISPPAHTNLIPKLTPIAPVETFRLYHFAETAPDDWLTIENMTRALGRRVQDPHAAQQLIMQTQQQMDQLKAQVAAVKSPLLLVRLIDERHLRIFGPGSLEGMVLKRLGLTNAWTKPLGRWGFVQTTADQVFQLNARLILLESPYVETGLQQQLLSQGVWQYWASAQRGDHRVVPINFWSWGGLPSAQRFATGLVQALKRPSKAMNQRSEEATE
ncbi:ABC transporter substrate-binding protein [Terasakiispira papahanaumokuakeensis]|nr:ABC transporter substrate-binding protein [Terasakiispira papahanaumokuakeensis]